MNNPYLIVLDRTALSRRSLAALVSAFSGKPLLTADLTKNAAHTIVVPPRRKKPVDYCVAITTERFNVNFSDLVNREKRPPSVILEPSHQTALVSLPGRDVYPLDVFPRDRVDPHSEDAPPSSASPFVEGPSPNQGVRSCGTAGVSRAHGGSREVPRTGNDSIYTHSMNGQTLDYNQQTHRAMFVGSRDEPIKTTSLGKMSDCWRNLRSCKK